MHGAHAGAGRSGSAPADQDVDDRSGSLDLGFDLAVVAVDHEPRGAGPVGLSGALQAKADALDPALDDHPPADDACVLDWTHTETLVLP